jgi:hypothetical protein
MRYTLKHKVQCANCGKAGYAIIEKKTGEILNNWRYWGRIHNPQRDKYFWKWNNGKMDERVLNSEYDPKAKKYLGEYWEHTKCPE